MRERLEDIGRILEMVNNLMNEPVFDLWNQRPKDFFDWYTEQSDDRQCDILNDLAYGIQGISTKLGEIYTVASGQDFLNESNGE